GNTVAFPERATPCNASFHQSYAGIPKRGTGFALFIIKPTFSSNDNKLIKFSTRSSVGRSGFLKGYSSSFNWLLNVKAVKVSSRSPPIKSKTLFFISCKLAIHATALFRSKHHAMCFHHTVIIERDGSLPLYRFRLGNMYLYIWVVRSCRDLRYALCACRQWESRFV